ncbi:MAG: tyrosine-type recombinase/integrase [Bacteroidetes bacterium]|nr:tyrosine-type recombinase/integrase [Bacteroidota bacterium]
MFEESSSELVLDSNHSGRIFRALNRRWKGTRRNETSLRSAIDGYLDHLRASSLSLNTIYCYSRDLQRLLKEFGDINLKRISEEMLDKHIIHICSESSSQPAGRTGLREAHRSVSTINRIKIVYRSFFKWCFTKQLIENDLAPEIRLSKHLSQETVPIRTEEITRLLKVISDSTDPLAGRDKALFSVYAFSGIRKSEALALKVSDYDNLSKTISLQRSKGSSKKLQSIPSILSKILNGYVESNLKDAELSSPLFPGQTPNAFLSGRQASNRFDKWKKVAGIRDNLTIHSFRTAYASQLYRVSKDPLLVSHAMGHSSFNTTKRYIKEGFFDIGTVLEKTFSMEIL